MVSPDIMQNIFKTSMRITIEAYGIKFNIQFALEKEIGKIVI